MRRPTLLCIDDDPAILKLRQLVLQSAGYDVLVAASGPEGLRLFVRETVDAVLLDYAMPDMDGAEVLRRMRQIQPQIPVLLCSGCVCLESEVVEMFDGSIIKGQPPATLLQQIAALLAAPPCASKNARSASAGKDEKDSNWFQAAD